MNAKSLYDVPTYLGWPSNKWCRSRCVWLCCKGSNEVVVDKRRYRGIDRREWGWHLEIDSLVCVPGWDGRVWGWSSGWWSDEFKYCACSVLYQQVKKIKHSGTVSQCIGTKSLSDISVLQSGRQFGIIKRVVQSYWNWSVRHDTPEDARDRYLLTGPKVTPWRKLDLAARVNRSDDVLLLYEFISSYDLITLYTTQITRRGFIQFRGTQRKIWISAYGTKYNWRVRLCISSVSRQGYLLRYQIPTLGLRSQPLGKETRESNTRLMSVMDWMIFYWPSKVRLPLWNTKTVKRSYLVHISRRWWTYRMLATERFGQSVVLGDRRM